LPGIKLVFAEGQAIARKYKTMRDTPICTEETLYLTRNGFSCLRNERS
jgi:hypothetical protein